jgi:dinuclear metal center YbgI/SA1388 family protein
MAATVADIINIMESIAPSLLAEEWDNSGLQIGQKDWPVKKVRIALDPSPDVVDDACKHHADLLLTHHPLLFKALKSVNFSTPTGSILHKAVLHRLAIFSAHTNLDNAFGGVNDVLASKIGIHHLKPLKKNSKGGLGGFEDATAYKLAVYVPAEYEDRILNALFETTAGNIGDYSCCSFRNQGKGTFCPGTSAKPFTGTIGEITHADEIRIEAVVSKSDLDAVIAHLRKQHPYQTMAYDVYPLLSYDESGTGTGRIGDLPETLTLAAFARKIKENLKLGYVKVAGDPDLQVKKAALCSGSGSSLMNVFFSSDAEVYISGDLHYHDAKDAEAEGRGLIDIGHFASEHLMVEILAERIRQILSETGTADVTVEACGLEKDPFVIV